MNDDPYPRFGEEEMAGRRRALEEVMEASGVEHVIVYGAERSGSAIPWLTEWPVTREAALLVTPGERFDLLVQHYNHLPNAGRLAAGSNVDWGGPSTIEALKGLLEARHGPGQRVGVIGPLRYHDYQRLAAAMGDLVPLDGEYQQLRMVKSPEEIERLKTAARLSDKAVEAVRDRVEVGMDERQLAEIVETAYLADGATNQIHYFAVTGMSDPHQCVPAQFQSSRRITEGDILFCEISAAYWGYAGQVLRTFAIAAEPTPLFVDLHRAADEAYDAISAVVRPGAQATELVEASAVIEEMGFTTYDDLVHGYGGGYLPPVLGSKSRPNLPIPDLTLEEGMVLVIQPNVITTDKKAGVQTGHLIVVTADGHRPLHHAPRGLGRIA